MRTVTLCGSTKFKDLFQKIEAKMAREGVAVYTCSFWGHAEDKISEEEKLLLDATHMVKILNSEAIYVVSKEGYFGTSTRREVYFAKSLGKAIIFHEPNYPFAKEHGTAARV